MIKVSVFAFVLLLSERTQAIDEVLIHHHHHHGKRHHKKHFQGVHASLNSSSDSNAAQNASSAALLHQLNGVSEEISAAAQQEASSRRGELEVNGPLPADFADRFATEVARATGCKPEDIRVLNASMMKGQVGIDEIVFEAPPDIIQAVDEQAADPASKLATGPLRIFLIEKTNADDGDDVTDAAEQSGAGTETESNHKSDESVENAHKSDESVENAEGKTMDQLDSDQEPTGLKPQDSAVAEDSTPVEDKGIDVDTSMPYGELEPFGREDTGQELTRGSIRESDEMVDQLERAEVAEEKRAVFRALTRLRGAAITSFDGIAKSQTGNVDEYARKNHWRTSHPVRHLADEESDVAKWAFPDNADF